MKTKRTCKSIFMLVALFAVLSVFTSARADAAALVPKDVVTINDEDVDAPVTGIIMPAGTVNTINTVVPVKVNHSGVLEINGMGTNGIEMSLYADAACTKKVRAGASADMTFFGDNELEIREIDIPKAGTYYLGLSYWLGSAAAAGDGRVAVYAYAYNGDDRTLVSGRETLAYTGSSSKTVYHKIVMKSTGYIEISGNTYYYSSGRRYTSSLSCSILNSKKKTVGEPIYLTSSTGYTSRVAVAKGTYYIAVKTSYRNNLRYSSKAIKEKSGKSKKKAYTLKKKKAANGLMLMNESTKKADWFKIKLKKKSKFKIEIKNYGDDSISMEIITPKKVILTGRYATIRGGQTFTGTTKKKAPKGTYYVKITKSKKTYSAYYTVKMK